MIQRGRDGRPRLLSEADVQRVKLLAAHGHTHAAIARALDVSEATVWRRLRTPYKQRERRW